MTGPGQPPLEPGGERWRATVSLRRVRDAETVGEYLRHHPGANTSTAMRAALDRLRASLRRRSPDAAKRLDP